MCVVTRPAFARFEFPPALDVPPRPHWPLAATAQHVVLGHLRRLLTLRDQAYGGDVDAIRRLRVAARRARSALADFGALWRADAVREARRALGKLAQRLGAVRDMDVTLALVREITGGDGAPAQDAAHAALQRRRDALQHELHAALRAFELAGWPSRLLSTFAAEPIDLWRFVDKKELLRDGEDASDS